jgi:RHS repeat-associated protein
VKSGGREIGYSVDAIGRRIARLEDGVITARRLYQDALRPAAEYDGQGCLRWQFVYAAGRHVPDVAIDAAGVSYALVTDQVGSLRLVIRGSDGAIVQRMRHDAWGKVEEDFVAPGFEPMPFGFAGGMFDRTTGLLHFGAREYDPEVGRWVERDPSRFRGGLNMYEALASDPVNFIDVTGTVPVWVCGAAVGTFAIASALFVKHSDDVEGVATAMAVVAAVPESYGIASVGMLTARTAVRLTASEAALAEIRTVRAAEEAAASQFSKWPKAGQCADFTKQALAENTGSQRIVVPHYAHHAVELADGRIFDPTLRDNLGFLGQVVSDIPAEAAYFTRAEWTELITRFPSDTLPQ